MDKQYKCYECGESSSAYAWNQETSFYFSGTVFPVDIVKSNGRDSFDTYVCPECGEEQPRHVIEEVSHD